MPPVSVAAYTSKGATPQARVASARASAVSTSDEQFTARGRMYSRPRSCSSASTRSIDAYATRTSGWSASRPATISSSGAAASKRELRTNGLWIVAATRDDWCQAVVELTTAMVVRRVSPAETPAHSLARAYDAITVAHSRSVLGTRHLSPELPEVDDTQ